MSTSLVFLALRLNGPLQSWGFDSQYNRRNTGLMPTKSGIAGICCAAQGFDRGSVEENVFLDAFSQIKLTIIEIPRIRREKALQVRRLQDYHTVQNSKKADGTIKDCHITNRQYLSDASFGVVLEGNLAVVAQIATALQNPVWGIWLGRKSCIPSAPVYAGLEETWNDALRLLIGDQPISSFTHQVDVIDFADGKDSLPDLPVSFLSSNRKFSPRRVLLQEAKV
jgi:CRISPR system Cascade subunit CasD